MIGDSIEGLGSFLVFMALLLLANIEHVLNKTAHMQLSDPYTLVLPPLAASVVERMGPCV
jgi:hypothetical protein